MTVESTVSRVSYSGDGSSTEFTVPFYFLADAHLFVYVDSTLKTINTHYTVSGALDPDGGLITFLSAPANATTVMIYRCPPITQLIDYIAQDEFPAETHEMGLDKLTMICQCLMRLWGLTLHLPPWVTGVDTELPEPEAGFVIGWNATATGLQNYNPAAWGGAGDEGAILDGTEWLTLINAGIEGDMLVRGATSWELLPKGTPGQMLAIIDAEFGGTENPQWVTSPQNVEWTCIPCSDETTALTTGVKRTFRLPYNFRVTDVRASLTTAQASGTDKVTVDIKTKTAPAVSFTTIFSTLLTIDNTELTSTTAATAYALTATPTDIEGDSEWQISISAIDGATAAAGLKVYIGGERIIAV